MTSPMTPLDKSAAAVSALVMPATIAPGFAEIHRRWSRVVARAALEAVVEDVAQGFNAFLITEFGNDELARCEDVLETARRYALADIRRRLGLD